MGKSASDRVLRFFQNRANDEHAPVTVAYTLGMNPNTVRVMCRKLTESGDLANPRYGWYIYSTKREFEAALDEDKMPPCFHAIKLIADALPYMQHLKEGATPISKPEELQKCYEGADNPHVIREEVERTYKGLPNIPPLEVWGSEGNKMIRRLDWRGRRITISISERTLEIDLASSDNPLLLPQVDCFLSFLECFFYPYFRSIDWKMTFIGINYDFDAKSLDISLTPDGRLESITLRHGEDLIARWYRKKGLKVIRRENHAEVRGTLGELVDNLEGRSRPGNEHLMREVKNEIISLRKDVHDMQQLKKPMLNLAQRLDEVEGAIETAIRRSDHK